MDSQEREPERVRESESSDDELREEDVTLGDRLDDRVLESDELPEGEPDDE